MRTAFFICIVLSTRCLGQPNTPDSLYVHLVKAYDDLNATYLAGLHLDNAEAFMLFDGSHPYPLKGREEIQEYYEMYFEAIRFQQQQLLLTFKVVDRRKVRDLMIDNGYYRLEILKPGKPSIFWYGKFSKVFELQNNTWKIKTEALTNADFIEYENAVSKTIPEREELLYPPFYDALLGTYITEDHQTIVIGRSQVRLYACFEGTGDYRGMHKINATTWTTGKTVQSDEVVQTLRFADSTLEIAENGKPVFKAKKLHLYTCENIAYKNPAGVTLGGTLFVPRKPNGKGIVLVHGSGPQDRNGYASVIRLLADVFAREGVTVLTYDKQGVGQSEGNSDTASFEDLARDALAGIDYLKTRKELSLSKTGLGGSSQAGWIIAKAIEANGEKVDFALTIGAAGSGITVMEQNIYNTETVMRCTGSYSSIQIDNAIQQQRYFFEYLNHRKNARELDAFTNNIMRDTIIRDWLFPTSSQIDFSNRNQWFTALEINFDPLPVWKNYHKPVLMLLGEFDDSTPATRVKSKTDNLKNNNIQVVCLNNAQHLGLETRSVCNNDFSELGRFHKDFFATMKSWLSSL